MTCHISVIPDGPMLIRGARAVVDGDGREHQIWRPVVAVCQCGHSQRAPWCDGTHKLVRGRNQEPRS